MEYRGYYRERIIVNSGFRLPSLKQIIIWLVIITFISFFIGGVITFIDGGKYKATGKEITTNADVPSGNITHAMISLEMDTGNINLFSETSGSLLTGVISGKNAKTGPEQTFTSSNGAGYLKIKQETGRFMDPFMREDTWNLSINPDIPISLSVTSGAGNVNINPGKANLTDLAIHLGTGDISVDLSEWKGTHLPALITGGMGSMTIILPSNTSIATNLETGIGSRTILGLEGGDGVYYRTVPDHQAPVISLSVNQGIGDLTMRVES